MKLDYATAAIAALILLCTLGSSASAQENDKIILVCHALYMGIRHLA